MKGFWLLGLMVAFCSFSADKSLAASDPGDRFLDAYLLIQDADTAEKQEDWALASSKFSDALEILRELKSSAPAWNPHIIEFRIKYCTDHLTGLRAKVPAPAAPAVQPPSETPPIELPAPPATASAEQIERIRQLTAELQRAQEQIRQLQDARDDLQTKLQDALSQVAPAQTDPRIEELFRQNQELSTRLATAQTEIAALRERAMPAAPETPPAPIEPVESTELGRLRAELSEARAELGRTKQELQQSRVELGIIRQELEKSRAETVSARRSYEQIVAQLTEANRQLRAAQLAGATDDQIMRQLRKENALLQTIAKRQAASERPKGWWPFRRKPKTAAPQPAEPPEPATAMEESARERLVATLTAPPAPATQNPTATAASKVPGGDAEPPAAGSPAVRALLQEARAAAAERDFETAAEKYDAALQSEPDNVVAWSNLGVVRYQQGRLDEAELALRKAAAVAPNDSTARAMLGVVYFRKGLFDDAYSELTRAVALDPRNAEAHNYLGVTLSEKGWGPAAEQQIRRAIELNPHYADAHFNLAVLYTRLRQPRYELARYHYQKARDLGAAPDPQIEALINSAPGNAGAAKSATPATP